MIGMIGNLALTELILVFILGLNILITLALAFWVYRDAEKKGLNGSLWSIVVLFTSFIGFALYLLLERRKKA
ncbi:MAG: hypothetical protein DRJ37_04520 [Thermoprotei archaeon]|nr:MAG: hypothetical protein DRJ37_04520 [Thermoprotei archaeon]